MNAGNRRAVGQQQRQHRQTEGMDSSRVMGEAGGRLRESDHLR
jgi:hypothetical protein